MVSIHIVPVIAYLIIRRIYPTFRFKRETHAFQTEALASPNRDAWAHAIRYSISLTQ